MDSDQLRDNNPGATQDVYANIPEPEVAVEEPVADAPELIEESIAANEDEGGEIEEEVVEENPRTAKARVREQSRQINDLNSTIDDLTGLNQLGNPILPKLDLPIGSEVTAEQLDDITTRKANAIVDMKLAAQNNANRIKAELRDALSDYPELNPRNEEMFDEDLSDSVSESVKAFIRSNPTGDVRGFIDKTIKPFKRAVDKGVAAKQQTVAKQATQTALRPSSVPSTDKKFEELSISEMEKKLGFVN
jgi:hypothetical protein